MSYHRITAAPWQMPGRHVTPGRLTDDQRVLTADYAFKRFRTKAPDALPVIGPDPRLPTLWWLAGLGGYGLGASWELGRIAARALIEGAETLPCEVLPSRL